MPDLDAEFSELDQLKLSTNEHAARMREMLRVFSVEHGLEQDDQLRTDIDALLSRLIVEATNMVVEQVQGAHLLRDDPELQ